MYGITSKTAKFFAIASIALGVAAIASPAVAGGYSKGHGDYKRYGKPGHGYSHNHGYRHNRNYWRRHGHHGVRVYAWKPLRHRPAYAHRRIVTACHPVVGHGRDHFGRRAKFGGTMCYDRFGAGYVVAGSRHVIRYY